MVFLSRCRRSSIDGRLTLARHLVTGGAGFIGSHLVDSLLDMGHEVLVLDNLSGGLRENVRPEALFWEVDLRSPEFTRFRLDVFKPEVVWHLAADATEGRSQFTPRSAIDNNITAYENVLLPLLDKEYFKRMVLFSSMAAYGHGEAPFRETDALQPADVYGACKAAMECFTRVLGDVHDKEWVILRPHNVFGVRQRLDDPARNLIGIVINCILSKAPILIYGDGTQRRAFTPIRPAVRAILQAGFGESGQIYNIGSPTPVSVNEMVDQICYLMGVPEHPRIYVSARPCEVQEAWCNSLKQEVLGVSFSNVKTRHELERYILSAYDMGPQKWKWIDLEIDSPKAPLNWRRKDRLAHGEIVCRDTTASSGAKGREPRS